MWITENRASKAKRFLESDCADQERKCFDQADRIEWDA
jgi:hypothetical protein